MRILAVVLLLSLASACQRTPQTETVAPKDDSKEPVRDYALHGEVLRLDQEDKIAVIKHQAIGDWMGAMTMEFPVKDDKEFATLHEGETINATVHVRGKDIPVFWVDQIHEDTSAPAPAAK
jgi:Cu/Ag efflux protein CusF